MKAALKHLEEINRYKKIVDNSNNQYVINDYSKKIYRMQKELREYCNYKGYDYKKLLKNQ